MFSGEIPVAPGESEIARGFGPRHRFLAAVDESSKQSGQVRHLLRQPAEVMVEGQFREPGGDSVHLVKLKLDQESAKLDLQHQWKDRRRQSLRLLVMIQGVLEPATKLVFSLS